MHDDSIVPPAARAPGESATQSSETFPDGAEPPTLAESPPTESHAFAFHGSAGEYFRIWIVNALLTLLTGGIFAAWAKVRQRRYLRGQSSLMGHRFDYRADPWRLLIGHAVVATVFISYAVIGEVYPAVRIGALGVGILALPWLVVRSLAFNAHNTTYRGLRFAFRQTYGGAALTYFGGGLLVVLSCGTLYPGWVRHRRRFTIDSHWLGDARFRFEGATGPFYLAYIVGSAIMVGAVMLGGVITALLAAHGSNRVGPVELAPLLLLYGTAFYAARHLTFGLLFNVVWNHTRLEGHRFVATLSPSLWVKLQFQNLLAILGTAGLAYPWAVVRSQRYALSCLRLAPVGAIEQIVRSGSARGSAVGDTATEFIGLDFGV